MSIFSCEFLEKDARVRLQTSDRFVDAHSGVAAFGESVHEAAQGLVPFVESARLELDRDAPGRRKGRRFEENVESVRDSVEAVDEREKGQVELASVLSAR